MSDSPETPIDSKETIGLDYAEKINKRRIARAQELLASTSFSENFKPDEHFYFIFFEKYTRNYAEISALSDNDKRVKEVAQSIALKDSIELVESHREQAIDHLTGAMSRKAITNYLTNAKDKVKEGERLGLLFGDIDRFKGYNDTFGHHVGDLVLQSFTQLLQENLEAGTVLGRWGGEEFLIAASRLENDNSSVILAEKLRKAIEEQFSARIVTAVEKDISNQREELNRLKAKMQVEGTDDDLFDRMHIYETDIDPIKYGEKYDEERIDRYRLQLVLSHLRGLSKAQELIPTWKTTASFGVTDITTHNKTASVEAHISHADKALYTAKEGGRNSVWDRKGNATERLATLGK